MEINPNEAPPGAMNKIILGSVVPRPIAWVSSVDTQGRPNLAPFSFFNAVCSKPPTLLFCPGVRGLDGGTKDTYQNILTTKEFVINIVTEELGHIDYGYTKTRELLEKGDESRERVQKAVDFWYVRALDMFGRSGSKRAERYRDWGLKRRSNEEARDAYMNEVNPILLSMGLEIPDPLKGRRYI